MPRGINRLPKIKQDILAGLAASSSVRVTCPRQRQLAKVLRKELSMCNVKVESETPSDVRGMNRVPAQGVLIVTWKEPPT